MPACPPPSGVCFPSSVLRLPVSIILPIRNEAPCIQEVLTAVLAQDYPHDLLEIIVADGLSDDGTRAMVEALAVKDKRLKVIENPRRNTTAGLNLAIRAARGEVLVRVDGHGVVPPNYVKECVTWLRKLEAGERNSEFGIRNSESGGCGSAVALLVVGGAWDCVGRGTVSQAIALATSSAFGVGNAQYRTCDAGAAPRETDSVPFWVMRRQVFERIGLFREEMLCHEDYELNHRLRRAGGQVFLLPWLRSRYYVRSSLGGLAKQYWRYGIWKGRFLRSQPESLRFRHLVPPLFVAALEVTTVAALVGRPGRLGLGFLLGVYLCFLLAATATLVFRRERTPARSPTSDSSLLTGHFEPCSLRLAALLPLVFVTLHCCWGTGVWLGLLRGRVPGQPPKL